MFQMTKETDPDLRLQHILVTADLLGHCCDDITTCLENGTADWVF